MQRWIELPPIAVHWIPESLRLLTVSTCNLRPGLVLAQQLLWIANRHGQAIRKFPWDFCCYDTQQKIQKNTQRGDVSMYVWMYVSYIISKWLAYLPSPLVSCFLCRNDAPGRSGCSAWDECKAFGGALDSGIQWSFSVFNKSLFFQMGPQAPWHAAFQQLQQKNHHSAEPRGFAWIYMVLGDIPWYSIDSRSHWYSSTTLKKDESSQDCQEVPVEMALKRMIRAAGNLPRMLLLWPLNLESTF